MSETGLQLVEPVPQARFLDNIRSDIDQACGEITDRLTRLRDQRAAINAEIRELLGELELLERMARVRRSTKRHEDDEDDER